MYFLSQLISGGRAFIHSTFSKGFYVPETFLGTEDRTMKKSNKMSYPDGTYILLGILRYIKISN